MQLDKSLVILAVAARALAFSVDFPDVYQQCSDFTINFGFNNVLAVPPYNLQLLPLAHSSPQLISIPDAAWDESTNSGSFTTTVPFGADMQFVAVMQDANGPLAVSEVLRVQPAENQSCFAPEANVPSLNIFALNPSPPAQCQIQSISWAPPTGAEGDGGVFLSGLNITGYVPHGTMFTLNSALGDSFGSLNEAIWNVNVPAGQNYVLFFQYTDASGALMQEVSPLQAVQPATEQSTDCLRPGAPSATAEQAVVAPPTRSSSPEPTSSSDVLTGSSESRGSSNKGLSQGVLIIIIAASILSLFLIIAVGYWLLIRRRRQRDALEEGYEKPAYGRSQSPTSMNNAFKPLALSPTAPLGITLPGRQSPYSDEASNYSQNSRTPTPTGPKPNTPTRQYPFLSMLPIARSATKVQEGGGRKRSVKGRSKSAKDAALSAASWGNRGPLSVSLSEEEVRNMQTGAPGQSPPKSNELAWDRRSRLLTGTPFVTSPTGTADMYDRRSGQTVSNVRIRYMDLDQPVKEEWNAPPGTAL